MPIRCPVLAISATAHGSSDPADKSPAKPAWFGGMMAGMAGGRPLQPIDHEPESSRHMRGPMIALVALFWWLHAPVSAQSVEHQFKVGIETRLFRYMSATAEWETSRIEDKIKSVEFGLFSFHSATSSTISPGVPASSIGADLGYGFGDNLLLGSHLTLDYGRYEHENIEDQSAVQFAIVPHLDYVFSSSRKFKPFVGLQLGGQFSSVSNLGPDTSGNVFMFGAELGAFGFIGNALSIDPRISFLYSFGSIDTGNIEADINSLSIAILIGLSGWL